MTYRLKLSADLSLDLSLIAHSVDAIFIADREGLILWANLSFERISGYDLNEAVGRSFDFLNGTFTDKEELDRLRDSVRVGFPVISEILCYRKNGQSFWAALTLTPVKNEKNELTHFVGVMRDITERKEAERQIARLQLKLAGMKYLEGFIVQCAWDKTVRDKNGNFISIEEFIERYSDARISHGVSPNARDRLLPKNPKNPS